MGIISDKSVYKKRIIDRTIEDYLQVSGAICIEGPKWCGKTWTSAYHSKSEFLVGDPTNNFSNRQLAEADPSIILKGETPRLIDEWQEVPAIWDAVRAEVDNRHAKGQIILTGSSTPKTKGIMHSGAGRIVRVRMNTMSLYESGDSSGQISLHELCSGKLSAALCENMSIERLAHLIVRGGWPENVSNKTNVHLMPRSYMQTIAENDLNSLDDGVEYNRAKVELILKSLARNEATTASDLAILKDINGVGETLSRNTFTKYLEALTRLFIFNNQSPFSPNVRSSLRVKQAEKRHFADPAMACAMLNLTPEKLLEDLNTFGFLFESLAERDLSIYAQAFGAKLYHYQDYKDNEIDAVIELENGDWCAFEIKLGANRIDEGANNLIKVCSDLERSGGKPPIIKCVICGLGNAAYVRADGVFVVPVAALKD